MSKKKKNKPTMPKSFDQRSASKKATVLGTDKKKRPPLYAVFAIGLLVVTVSVYLYLNRGGKTGTVLEGEYSASSSADQLVFPVERFDDGKARHYEYKAGDFTIRYFIIKSSDGLIRAAFDACDVCWPANKGYFQQGDYMVCRNCGRQFASVLVNEVKGGCNPAPLNRTVKDNQVIIKKVDLLQGKQYFDFKGKV